MKEKDYVDQEEKELDEWFEKFFSEGRIVGVLTAEEARRRGLVSNKKSDSDRLFSEIDNTQDEQLNRLVKEALENKKEE